MYAALDVPARSRRNKPFPANKRDDLRVIQAYRSVCICAGNIMCSGEGEYLLGRVDGKNQKKIPHPKMEIFILDNAKVFLTTTNHDVFKSAFSAVCAICTRSELNALLHTLLQERNSNDNGKYVIEPRLQRCWQRVLMGLMLLASVNSNPANCYMHTGAKMVNTQEGQLSAEFRNVL
jgi:hypothetical protein